MTYLYTPYDSVAAALALFPVSDKYRIKWKFLVQIFGIVSLDCMVED